MTMARFGPSVIAVIMSLLGPACAGQLKGIPSNGGIHSVSRSLKYLISSFPNIKTVAYTHLPDTIWRPLFLGTVSKPMGVVTDPLNDRLYVADQGLHRIFWYQLVIEPNGLLKTDGHQHVAVDGVTAHWMNVNGLGDLYFSGEMVVKAPAKSARSVYRMDVSKINSGDPLNPAEVYTKSNSGFPNPRALKPSGVAVDSFNVYWGNEEKGTINGAVCSGSRQNVGITSSLEINVISKANAEVRGMSIAGQSVFYITPQAIYGQDRTSGVAVTDTETGLIQSSGTKDGWDPKSIAFDGENTMYWTDAKAGIIYEFPAGDMNKHPLKKYVDAPLVYGVTTFSKNGEFRADANTAGKRQDSRLISARAEESGSPAVFRHHLLATFLAVGATGLAC